MNVKSNKKRKTRKIRLGMKASVIQNGVRTHFYADKK